MQIHHQYIIHRIHTKYHQHYNFHIHYGYPTRQHIQEIHTYGIIRQHDHIHRLSTTPVQNVLYNTNQCINHDKKNHTITTTTIHNNNNNHTNDHNHHSRNNITICNNNNNNNIKTKLMMSAQHDNMHKSAFTSHLLIGP